MKVYICKYEDHQLVQMDLKDFMGDKKKIIFDMGDEREARQALKIIGDKRIRKKKKPPKKKINYKSFDSMFLNKKPPVKKKKSVPKPKLTIQKKKSPLSPIKKPIKKSPSNPIKKPTKKEIEPQQKKTLDVKKTIVVQKKEAVVLKQYLLDDILNSFGSGGMLEMVCPMCGDIVYFDYKNLDEKTIKSTRICDSCDAVTRISSLGYNKRIFDDLLGSLELNLRNTLKIKKKENRLKDQSGNSIYTYGFDNLV